MYKKNLYSDGTSEDSEGKDSSFESINDELDSEQNGKKEENENKSVKLLENLRFKQQKYQELIRKTKQKGEENGKKSPWCTLYYTFFNNFYKKNFVTLNEINLRCRFLWKIDQLEKEAKRSKSDTKDYINKPLTNLNELLDSFTIEHVFNCLDKKEYKTFTYYVDRDYRKDINDNNELYSLIRNATYTYMQDDQHLDFNEVYRSNAIEILDNDEEFLFGICKPNLAYINVSRTDKYYRTYKRVYTYSVNLEDVNSIYAKVDEILNNN